MLSSVAAACLALCVLTSNPAVLDVPGAYPTVQAAIDAANSGDTVYVHAGTYDEALVFKAGVTLDGAGRDRVTVRRPAADGPVLTISQCGDGTVRGISFEHLDPPAKDSVEAKPSPVVEIVDSSIELLGCETRNSGGSGIRIQGKSTCKVLACSVLNSMRIGIIAVGPDVTATFVGNSATGNTCGISFQEGARGTAKINRCLDNNSFGIEVVGRGNPLLFGNTCSKNGGCGIICREDSMVLAHGNHCEENGASGIAVHDNAAAALKNNVLVRNTWNGIWYSCNCDTDEEGNKYVDNHELDREEASRLFVSGQYANLEEISTRLRREKLKTYGGEWQLENLYEGIVYYCNNMSEDQEKDFQLRIQEWKTAFPNSLTCAIVEADGYLQFAWRERGGGWVSEVTREGWTGFRNYLNKAFDVIKAAEKLPERDPHLYVVKSKILLGLGKTSVEVPPLLAALSWWTNTNLALPNPAEQAFLQGIAVEPTYYPLYDARTTPLLPRWGGSPTAMVNFAESSVKATENSEGQSLYARIAADALHCEGREDYLSKYRFSWPRIRQGYRDLLERYPQSQFRLNQFCLMSCIHGDRETAKHLFAQIDGCWNGNVWENETHFNRWQDWATKGTDNPSADPLEKAVRDGDVPELERLLRAGGNPNGLSENGRSLLVVAIDNSNEDIIEALLANGADVNFAPPEGMPPIVSASRDVTDDAFLRLLIEHKANPNVAPPDGWSPLLYSIGRGLTGRVKFLLDHGANPNDTVNGACGIWLAIDRNDLESIRALVDKGADVNLKNDRGTSPLSWAEECEKKEIAAFLREHGATR